MNRLAVFVAFVVGLANVAGQTGQSTALPVTDWIRSNAIKLSTGEAGKGLADMQALKPLVGNARIVSLGESTHGTREFFQLKHRMLEFLATEMGFSIFSIEASMPEAYRLNDYVLNGKGDPAALLKGMYFWTWDTEEVLDMIRWMREFNASGKGRLQFTGFDMQTSTVAIENLRQFAERYDSAYLAALDAAAQNVARVEKAVASNTAANNFAVVNGTLPPAVVAGKKVRFTGYIKTEGVTRNFAGLWFRANGASGVVAFDNMQNRGATGTTDWKQYAIDLAIPDTVTSVVFGALMPGDGIAWFDDLAIEIDGKPFVDDRVYDFGFEAPALRGFQGGGNGYRIDLDSQLAHGGKQSLRIAFIGPPVAAPQPPTSAAVSPAAVIATYQDVIRRLEANRARYRAEGATELDVEWAIQHAHLVMQGLQMRAGQVSRDRSMADNVKWILDRNPGAKIVLWAHNGHVAAGGFGFPPMGASLRQMFGREMIVFGFAFNQGEFQSMRQTGGGLKNFAVPPLPSTSLDATLASAGLPVFALNLRNAPAWFREPRASRQIGATYPEGSLDAFAMPIVATEAFDVMLFVESTTAARRNPR